MVKSAMREEWQRDGYVICRGLLPRELVCAAAAHLEAEVLDENRRKPEVAMRVQATFGTSGAMSMAKVNGLVEVDEIIGGLARRPEVVDVIEALLGVGARRFRDVLIVKPPHSSGVFRYHQDSAYWDVEPKALCSAWIALGDVPVEASCLTVVPGSHAQLVPHTLYVGRRRLPSLVVRALRGAVSMAGTGDALGAAGGNLVLWRLKKLVLHAATTRLPWLAQLGEYQVPPEEIGREVALPVQAGDVIFFHSLLLHASGPNTSAQPRYASIVSYMGPDARFVGRGRADFPLARS
jgi:ectoine hydroxylase-related dioxygenase (phytanoyl-CoA dioxygenase family)